MATIATPLAFGMWTFSLPDTRRLWLHWDGPGSGLFLASDKAMRPVGHASASGIYQTRKQAQAAAEAFVAAGLGMTETAGGVRSRETTRRGI